MARTTKKKKKKQAVPSQGFGSKSLSPELAKAEALMNRGQWTEARDSLVSLSNLYPDNVQVLRNLIDVYAELEYNGAYQYTCEKLLTLKPNDSTVTYLLGQVYLINYNPLLALQVYKRALDHWPNHEHAYEAREQVDLLESNLSEIVATLGFKDDELELATHYEKAKSQLETAELDGAIATLQTLLADHPTCLPAQHLLCRTYFQNDQLDEAIAQTQQILESHPDNTEALAHIIRCLVIQGSFAEAQTYQPRLMDSVAPNTDALTYKAEALGYLGDDEALISLLDSLETDPTDSNEPLSTATIHHLIAVALARQGKTKAAREQWKIARDIDDELEVITENLQDLNSEAAYQNGPWPFQINRWFPNKALQGIRDIALAMSPACEVTDTLTQTVQQYLKKYPYVEHLIPTLLERGGPRAKLTAIGLAQGCNSTEAQTALKSFVLGQSGPDQIRYQLAGQLAKADHIPLDAKLWLDGEWRTDFPLITYRIIEKVQQSPQVEALLGKALKKIALESAKAGQAAEALLQEALEIEPNNPALLNQLSIAYDWQGKYDESEALTDQILERHPDDVASNIAKVRVAMDEENFDSALKLLQPLLKCQDHTADDFVSLVFTYSKLLLDQGKTNLARLWFQESTHLVPDHPFLRKVRKS